jgi:hypothetical protein
MIGENHLDTLELISEAGGESFLIEDLDADFIRAAAQLIFLGFVKLVDADLEQIGFHLTDAEWLKALDERGRCHF